MCTIQLRYTLVAPSVALVNIPSILSTSLRPPVIHFKCHQEIIHYNSKFREPYGLGLSNSRFLFVPAAGTAPRPSRGHPGTCGRREWRYHRYCAESLKDRRHASSRPPIHHRLQRSHETSCMLELVYVEEGKLPEVKHGPATTPAEPTPTTPNIATHTAGNTNAVSAPTGVTHGVAAACGC